MISRVDFIGLPTRDLEAAVAFYGETLGLERSVYRPDRQHAEFETGNLTVNLMVAEKMGLPYVVSQNPIALHVDDVAESRATLAGRGVSFMGDIVDTACATWRSSRTPTGTRSCCTTATRRSRRAAAARLCARATLDPRKQRG